MSGLALAKRFNRSSWLLLSFLLVACVGGGIQGGGVPGNPQAAAPDGDSNTQGDGSIEDSASDNVKSPFTGPTLNYASSPVQISGAPSPGFDPEGVVYIPVTLKRGDFTQSQTNDMGMIAAKISGWADGGTILKPDGKVVSIPLDYHILRVVDPEKKTYVDVQLKAANQTHFVFDMAFLMTAERFQQLTQNFDLELSISSKPARNFPLQLFPISCPPDAEYCGRHVATKVQWTKINLVEDIAIEKAD